VRDRFVRCEFRDELLLDVRHACRLLLGRDRSFALTAVTMLTLAISLNVMTFTLTQAMLFRGLPLVQEPLRLVMIQEVSPDGRRGVSYPDFEEWAAQVRSFDGMLFVAGSTRMQFIDDVGRPADLSPFKVTAGAFGLLGVHPLLGRDFVAADDAAGAPLVVILNYRFWAGRFEKRADVVGKTVHVGGAPATIVGVMPERFEFPSRADFWMPAGTIPSLRQRNADTGGYIALGRLRPGATVQKARTELELVHRRLQDAYPETNRRKLIDVVDNAHSHAGPNAPVIYLSLWAGACFVLLIACANVSNLSLVRTIGRWREFSTRIALGGGRWRLARQMLVEHAIIVAVAGALAWRATTWGIGAWAASTTSPYQILDYSIDATTIACLAAVCVVSALLYSIAPIVRLTQLTDGGAIVGHTRGVTQPMRSRRLSAGLVAGQMALAIVLLSGAGVLVRSLLNIVGAETGVRAPERILVGTVRLPSITYPTPGKRTAYIKRLEGISIPGVQDVAVATALPASGGRMTGIDVEGMPSRSDGRDYAQLIAISPAYFKVIGVTTVAGRAFSADDRMSSPLVAMVNESFVAKYLPGREPIGLRIRFAGTGMSSEWRTIVGVAPNIMEGDAIRQEFKPVLYAPLDQEPTPRPLVLARTVVPPSQSARPFRAAVEQIDRDATLEGFQTLTASFAFDGDYMDLQHMELGKNAAIAPVFAAVALLLAAVGLYSVIAHSVGQRTQEIGIRVAIGATASDIRRLVQREGLTPAAIGIAVGLAGSLAVNRILQSQLVEVSPHDPVTIAGAIVALIGVALIASHVPARRATRVDPIVALRHE
jgi:putative ABC transport system permease protein